MEKLELKHLAPYLPYGLEFYLDHLDGTPSLLAWTLTIDSNIRQLLKFQNKPILRPLSDLTKDIIISGINRGLFFVPYDELKNVVSKEQWIKVCKTIDVDSGEYSKICDMPHWWVEKLFEWHFDVFGLIEKDLAIDINTLKQ